VRKELAQGLVLHRRVALAPHAVPNFRLIAEKVDSTLLHWWYCFKKSYRWSIDRRYIFSKRPPGAPVMLLLNGAYSVPP
jgi:hypothetical protein